MYVEKKIGKNLFVLYEINLKTWQIREIAKYLKDSKGNIIYRL